MTIPNLRLTAIVITVGLLLLIPFFAMKFTNEVNWGPFDFLVAGVLLLGTGLACEAVLRLVKGFKYRVALVAVILAGLFLVWAEVAVGLFGTRFAGS